ncbi:radical SAM protein [Nanoarchaeota archaeon]
MSEPNERQDSGAPKIERNMVLDGHKMVYHLDRVKAWLRGERVAPITIDMALTRACNFRCSYCYSALQENQGKSLTKEVMFRFLDDAAEIGVKAISLVSDGESTVSPIFYDTIAYGKSKGIDMAVGTNGALLKKEKMKDMLRDLTYLRFNISAGEAERYAKIHGVPVKVFHDVCEIIKECARVKKENDYSVTIGLQMVLMPGLEDQVIPLARLGRELGVDYLVIKHTSDDEDGSLGVDYSKYAEMESLLKEVETYSTDSYLVKVKWSKIMSEGKRSYSRCFGPPFIIQFSGTGLVAPCGPLFNDKYQRFHIGNLAEKSFKEIWQSDRYWEVMDYIASGKFNAKTDCGTLCLQHKVNEFLDDVKSGKIDIDKIEVPDKRPDHINFI